MMEWIIYVAQVSFASAGFFGLYYVVLSRLTFYRTCRIYLLASLLLAFALPLVQAPTAWRDMTITPVVENWGSSETYELVVTKVFKPLNDLDQAKGNMAFVLPILYFLVLGILCLRCIFNLIRLYRLRKNSNMIYRGVEVFRTSFPQSFSFFSGIFIPQEAEAEKGVILEHEYHHVRLGHSYDRVVIDFMVAFLWFNPFIYLYRKALIETHEFEADHFAAQNLGSRTPYLQLLLRAASQNDGRSFVSYFNFSMIKKRIIMMNKNKSQKRSLIPLLLILPLTVVLISSFSTDYWSYDEVPIGKEPQRMGVGQISQDDIPNIFPLEVDGEKIKITSGFGMRMHPIKKVKMFHQGIDIRAKTGTPVLATANGIASIRPKKDGYGNMVILKHGNGYVTRYAQLSAFYVQDGEYVKKGQVIAYVGSSGQSTAPHLHYEVIKDGEHVNPQSYMAVILRLPNSLFPWQQIRVEQDC
ncbi:MAG: peptidoglycan DD-metalloendopeptidase family protein [Cyclobacteriaceae bacterium]|nr:peptidoglycan DD-metalloendopeptidase family protein [Cyclobacteriaceae bacterium HetDA_MAG_MS6]